MSDCDHCGQTLAACDTQLRESGTTCCAACLMSATHGVVDEEFHSLARRVAGLDKVVAQLVTDNILLRSELTNHQLELMECRLEALEQQVVKLEHDVGHVPADGQLMLDGFVAEVRETAGDMSKRLRIVEACIQGIEAKLKLRRKDDPEKVIEALESSNVVTPSTRESPPSHQWDDDEEPRRRWWHRNKDGEEEW